jgi:dihydropteroate synthase
MKLMTLMSKMATTKIPFNSYTGLHKSMVLCFKNRQLDLSGVSRLMGIVNVTPDSFSDGGRCFNTDTAVAHGLRLVEEGADIIDIGGESTRPGSAAVDPEEEISRIVPVIRELKRKNPDCIISADTRKADVAVAAATAGADIINDVTGLQHSSKLAAIAAEYGTGLILMHMRGTPTTMQSAENLEYADVVKEVAEFLLQAVGKAIEYGVKRENIVIDPGIGFSKTPEQNLELIGRIDEIRALGFPVLAGHSRKSFIGAVLGRKNPEERIWGTAGVTAFLTMRHAEIIRVHDVAAMKDVITMFSRCVEFSYN